MTSPINEFKVRISQEEAQHFQRTNPDKFRLIVNSVGKSGTTWLRGILATLPGYRSVDVRKEGFTGGRLSELRGTEVGEVFHGHFTYSDKVAQTLRELEFKGVAVFRDIRDAIVSEYHHQRYLDPASQFHEYLEETPKEDVLMAENIMRWCGAAKKFEHSVNWKNCDLLVPMKYEEMRLLPVTTLRRVLQQMGFKISYPLTEKIVQMNSFERLSGRQPGQEAVAHNLRKGVIGDWRNHFTERNLQSVHEAFGPAMESLGYRI